MPCGWGQQPAFFPARCPEPLLMGHLLPWGGHCSLIPVKTKLCTGILQNSHLRSHWGTVLAFRHLPCCLSLVSFLQGLHYELILSTFFFISKEYQLTFTASSALPKPHITPKCSFSLPEGLSQHEWFYESCLYFSLKSYTLIEFWRKRLEPSAVNLSCVMSSRLIHIVNLQMAKQCCYLLKTIVLSKFWWKNDVAGVMIVKNNSHIFPRAWAERGGAWLWGLPDPSRDISICSTWDPRHNSFLQRPKLTLQFQAG